METVALESDGKQMKRNENGINWAEIMQKIFSHFFDYSDANSALPILA